MAVWLPRPESLSLQSDAQLGGSFLGAVELVVGELPRRDGSLHHSSSHTLVHCVTNHRNTKLSPSCHSCVSTLQFVDFVLPAKFVVLLVGHVHLPRRDSNNGQPRHGFKASPHTVKTVPGFY